MPFKNTPALLFVCFNFYTAYAQPSASYYQDIKTDIALPAEAGKNTLKLFQSKDQRICVTSTGIFRFKSGKWTGQKQPIELTNASLDGDGNVWLATARGIYSEKKEKQIIQPPLSATDTILTLFWETPKQLWVGTNNGLMGWNGQWTPSPNLKERRVNSIAKDAQGQLYVATNRGLWRRTNGRWFNLDESLMAVGNKEMYFALTHYNSDQDMVYSSPWSVGCIANDGNHWVLRATDGLPYGPVMVLTPFANGLWMGTQKGLIKKDSRWQYYLGKRWLPDNQVNDILVVDSLTIWVATPQGIAQIQQQAMTLEAKAAYIEKVIELRHNRRGLVNHARLKEAGDIATSYLNNEDNDGLWTACYLVAECFHYASTGDTAAKNKAIRTFEALERLEKVSGISGYPARSYALATDPITQSRSPHPKLWHPSPDGQWQWLDDTSSDEITGHIFALPLFYDLVANDEQKERVKQLIKRTVDHIVDHNYHLIDFDGKPTRWGIWHPDSLNHSPNWMYERGLNSLQILSFLKTAYHFTGDEKYEKHYQYLVNQHGYAKNALQAKVFGPFETSHSDDILNFFPYYGLLNYTKADPNRDIYLKSLERSWKAVSSDHMPIWNVMASVMLRKDCDVAVALEEIQQFPLDLINWRMENSHRWDLPRDPLLSRFRRLQSTKPIPTPESSISRWNTNPKEFDSGDGGKTEDSGSYYLFAYWMGRYYGFWK
ncbi:hypothetical protein [Runella limosa]|uniref:hypothetical protein n=1 Tax=Runella limosa TaxID=370978 RepID=UPI000407D1A3|nr:hypothetical protein [Runella limosa]